MCVCVCVIEMWPKGWQGRKIIVHRPNQIQLEGSVISLKEFSGFAGMVPGGLSQDLTS